MTRPVVLIVLDGFGIGDGGSDDATTAAHAPFFTRMRQNHPTAQIETSGAAVGLRMNMSRYVSGGESGRPAKYPVDPRH